ncbi:sensor histidine kinase [Promicromonospora sp. NFX87]|uniref:sensor histidine kinase n=1 Tax=Promicromonospora sp. NFX87 TaxID=3402691 RepID=UPI003AFB43FD
MSAIRSVWDEPRPADPPVRVWRDWVLVAVVVAGAMIEAVARSDVQGRWLELATVVVLAPTLLWRRTHPLATVVVAFVASTVPALVLGRDLAFASNVFMLVLAYALFRWGSGRAMVLGTAVVLAKMGANAALGFLTLADVGIGCLILGSTFALGLALRYRSGARRREREQVVLLERERLARDLHDVVGHHISAVAVRAQAGLAVSQTDPGAAADSLRVIEEQASLALAEMRMLVRVLRSDELRPAEGGGDRADEADELAPGPTLADVERLADPTTPRVEVDLEGDPARVSAAVGGAVQRIAQESVTNARRHARGATRITVRVTVGETSVRLRVSDDGGAPVPPSHGGYRHGGYGLAGMRERAALLGGTLDAGPDAAGWTVEAVLPISGAA